MRTVIDESTCIGCGLCASICPKVYEMEDNIAVVISELVPESEEECAKSAANDCPVTAITVE